MSHIQYSSSRIAQIIHADFLQFCSDSEITELSTDSRQAMGGNFLFFAIVSGRNDGHNYIADAYQKGVRNFIISREVAVKQHKPANFMLVDDTLQALQVLAKHHRSLFSLPLIGITGSNGKTTVKEWLYQLLQADLKVVRSPKSYNSQIGVPLSAWRISTEDELGIFEAGISQKNEMQRLEEIICPQIGLLTNIGDAHLENFNSKEEIAREKIKLFENCETVIFCADQQEAGFIKNEVKAQKLLAWSYKESSKYPYVKEINRGKSFTKIFIKFSGKEYQYRIPFLDAASIENSISCFFALSSIGHLNEKTLKRMEELQPIAMRLEIKEGIQGSLLINDSYNSDFQSLKIALQLLSQYDHKERKVLIFSDLVQISQNKDAVYQQVAELVFESNLQLFVGIGPDMFSHQKRFPASSLFYEDVKQFLQDFDFDHIANSAVLIKGARKFGMEKISEVLQQKSHETVLEINLNFAVDNLNYFRSLLKKRTKIMAMVKAFSYGAGSVEIAKVLQFHQVDYLGVAYADEGLELRKAGIFVPIMVMNPEIESYETMIRNQLEPEIFSFRVLEKFLQSLAENQYFASSDDPYPIHLKLDTGMRRLGFSPEDILQLANILSDNPKVKVVSVFSHLTSAEEPSHDEFTKEQVRIFEEMAALLSMRLEYQPLKHILNSSGVLRFPEFQFDMVRLGIGLYGVSSEVEVQKKLKYVSRLTTHISQVKTLKANETVGYFRSGVKEKGGKIATIPIGYADGLGRALGNGKWQVQIGNRLFPTIGNVCMDMCMIDLLDAEVEEGAEVLIFGGKRTVKDLAIAMGKSAYEVLTGISGRVKRIYFFE